MDSPRRDLFNCGLEIVVALAVFPGINVLCVSTGGPIQLYMKSRSLIDQNYLPGKRKIVKPTKKWRVPASELKEFKFSVDTNQSKPPWKIQTGGAVFKFGNTKAKETLEEPKSYSLGHNFVFGKAQVESKKAQGPGRIRHMY